MKIGAISDFHFDVDYPRPSEAAGRMGAWIASQDVDVVLVAGDLSHDLDVFQQAGQALTQPLDIPALFVPGNHDLWVENSGRASGASSEERLWKILPDVAAECGLHPLWTHPRAVGEVWFAGSYGHYDFSFARPDLFNEQIARTKRFGTHQWVDARFMRWPSFQEDFPDQAGSYPDDRRLCQRLIQDLKADLKKGGSRTKVALTHTVPFEDGIVYKGDPNWDVMNAFMGSRKLGQALTDQKVQAAVYGHTHINHRFQHQHVQAVCPPMGYYQSREWGPNSQTLSPLGRLQRAWTVLEVGP